MFVNVRELLAFEKGQWVFLLLGSFSLLQCSLQYLCAGLFQEVGGFLRKALHFLLNFSAKLVGGESFGSGHVEVDFCFSSFPFFKDFQYWAGSPGVLLLQGIFF